VYQKGRKTVEEFYSAHSHHDKQRYEVLVSAIEEALEQHHLTLRYIFIFSNLDKKLDILCV